MRCGYGRCRGDSLSTPLLTRGKRRRRRMVINLREGRRREGYIPAGWMWHSIIWGAMIPFIRVNICHCRSRPPSGFSIIGNSRMFECCIIGWGSLNDAELIFGKNVKSSFTDGLNGRGHFIAEGFGSHRVPCGGTRRSLGGFGTPPSPATSEISMSIKL